MVFQPDRRDRRTWTSDLSVAEAAAVRRVGMVPAGFVMGTAVMQLAAAGGQLFSQWGGLAGQSLGRPGGYSEAYPCAASATVSAPTPRSTTASASRIPVLASSLTEGYRLAIERLHDEATELGAHGVVGIDLFFENLVGSAGHGHLLRPRYRRDPSRERRRCPLPS